MDFLLLEQEEIDFLEYIAKDRHIPALGKFAKVEVGITTGSNDFSPFRFQPLKNTTYMTTQDQWLEEVFR